MRDAEGRFIALTTTAQDRMAVAEKRGDAWFEYDGLRYWLRYEVQPRVHFPGRAVIARVTREKG